MTRNAPYSDSLAARIDDAERLLLERQRALGAQGSRLRHRIHERMTSPALLGSAVALGFLLGHRTGGPGSDRSGSDRSWLRMAVSSMPWMHTLFTTAKPGAPSPGSSSSESSG